MTQQPAFWSNTRDWRVVFLLPVSVLYDLARRLRNIFTTPAMAGAPVICVGNLTVGGVGKSPTVRKLIELCNDMGLRHAVATRGYGGSLYGPIRVRPETHSFKQVGDEPLMLARDTTVWKAANRSLGIMAARADADIVIMDDGKQNPTIYKAATIVVVDAATGFGNGFTLPAGPLREPVRSGLRGADLILLMTDPSGVEHPETIKHIINSGAPIVRGRLAPIGDLPSPTVEALAGIGRPEKFFATLRANGITVTREYSFPDHHAFKRDELHSIIDSAQAPLITTEKDMMRIPPDLRENFNVLPVALVCDDDTRIRDIIKRVARSPQYVK